MKTEDETNLIAYVLGDVSADVARDIEARAAGDPELAAEIAVLRTLGGPVVEAIPQFPSRRFPTLNRAWTRRAAIGLIALVLAGGASWAGYSWLRVPPLLSDHFSTGTVNYKNWASHLGRKGVRAEKGYLRLMNRGSIVTKEEFDAPIEISLDWRWIDLGDWPLYAEDFFVVLRTTGHHDRDRPFLIKDGVEIRFSCTQHNVSIASTAADFAVHSAHDSSLFTAEAWHHIRIVDDGKTISVYLSGPHIDPKFATVPVLVATPLTWPEGKQIAIFNRELIADINHESHIDNVVVRRLLGKP